MSQLLSLARLYLRRIVDPRPEFNPEEMQRLCTDPSTAAELQACRLAQAQAQRELTALSARIMDQLQLGCARSSPVASSGSGN